MFEAHLVAVTSNTRDPQFESWHMQRWIYHQCKQKKGQKKPVMYEVQTSIHRLKPFLPKWPSLPGSHQSFPRCVQRTPADPGSWCSSCSPRCTCCTSPGTSGCPWSAAWQSATHPLACRWQCLKLWCKIETGSGEINFSCLHIGGIKISIFKCGHSAALYSSAQFKGRVCLTYITNFVLQFSLKSPGIFI